MSREDVPRLGLGTYGNTDPVTCADTVRDALELGYRHVDTAQSYDNEDYVGDGIADANVDRDDVYLATKVSTDNLAYEDVIDSTAESLRALGVDYVDLLYVHWPVRTYDATDTLRAFDDLHDEGTIRHVGVSNFEPEQLDEARAHLDASIVANQVELHPLLPQEELREYAREHDHWLVAYCPLARGDVFGVPEIESIAEKHDATAAQVSLAWIMEKGAIPIPKATGEHVAENWAARTVSLDEEDVARIDAIDARRRLVDPDDAPWSQ